MRSEDERLKFLEVENHPTISQDWTNKDINDHKRLVALQKTHGSPKEDIEKPVRIEGGSVYYSFQHDPQLHADGRCMIRTATPRFTLGGSPKSPSEFYESQPIHPARFPCHLCPKRYTRASVLRFHLRTHTEARPFICTVCGKAFGRQHDYKRHEALHRAFPELEEQDIQVTVPTFDDEDSSPSSIPSPSHEPFTHRGSLGNLQSEGIETDHEGFDGMYEQNEVMRNESSTNMTGHQQRKRRRKDHNSCGSESELATTPDIRFERGNSRKREVSASQQSTEIQALRRELEALKSEKGLPEGQTRGIPQRYQIIYRIHRASEKSPIMYLDQPQWLTGDKDMASLQGQLPIARLDSYLDRHPEVVFIIFRDMVAQYNKHQADDEGPIMQWSESMTINSPRLIKTLKRVVDEISQFLSIGESFDFKNSEVTLAAPYLVFYHYREFMVECASFLKENASYQWSLLLEYIDNNFAEQYEYVKKLLDAGNIHRGLIHYMIKEGDVLISQRNHTRSAYAAASRPTRVPNPGPRGLDDFSTENIEQPWFKSCHRKQQTDAGVHTKHLKHWAKKRIDPKVDLWNIKVEFWEFDGNFQRALQTIQLHVPSGPSEILSVRDLELFPIEFADAEQIARLKAVGSQFWKSRTRRYVSYRPAQAVGKTDPTDLRYMIDPTTYKELHKKDASKESFADDLGPDLMNGKEAPPDPFLLLLPNTIDGFNIQSKRWEKLEVSQISDVSWNKDAFENLVIEPFAKTLVKALVIQQLEKEKGTDLIAGKGQGLIVLLHGGPGTGKTFTAETVAEIAEKPLYRVTCGDLGAEPMKIETYLESVLYLGKIWNCVVLLDEADVYLEERSMESLARNALVSVFLRVLEYYEGILILTTNRVGTFDESFKSRIQLALHYDRLKFKDRCLIWENFFRRLEKFAEVGIDFDDIYRHLKDLARNEMNGRQIRNAITTSRQLAKHQGKDLEFTDLQQVIKVALQFDKHTTDLQGGMNDDERKREDGIRP